MTHDDRRTQAQRTERQAALCVALLLLGYGLLLVAMLTGCAHTPPLLAIEMIASVWR